MLLPSWQTLTTLSFPANFFGRLAILVTILLVLVLAHTLAYLTWNLWPGPESSPTPHRLMAAQLTITQVPESEVIVKTHLFGKVDRAHPMAATLIAVPKTPLNLALRGIIAASFPDGGAIIAEQGGSDHFFQVGALITNGVVLQEVYPDHVILARNQRLETLHLSRGSLDTNPPQSTDETVPKLPQTNLESSTDDAGNVQSLNYYNENPQQPIDDPVPELPQTNLESSTDDASSVQNLSYYDETHPQPTDDPVPELPQTNLESSTDDASSVQNLSYYDETHPQPTDDPVPELPQTNLENSTDNDGNVQNLNYYNENKE
ncbi:general secretion pathway protein C [Gammaproteobacteria bacterium]